MSTFTARYNSVCGGCAEWMREGDEVVFAGGAVVHVECPESADDLAVTGEVCPGCFMVPAANGACGCG